MGDENNGIPGAEVYLRVEDLLKVLDFTQKQLSELPENILEFKNTEEAILAENSFTVIPSALFELPHLIVCNLSNNRIENFGPIESLAKWKKLQTLRLSFNSIATIPSEITFLSSLKILELENNKILELPEEIGNLSHLTQLNITNNQIEKIPINILNHQTLKYLYCDCNKIEKLPQAPDKFSTKLQKITLCKNPLCLPDPAITQLRNHGVSVLITNPLADSNGTDDVTLLKPIRSTHHKRSYSHAGESTTPTELASPFNRPASFSRQLKRASNSTFGSVRNTRARAQDSPTWKRLKSRESVKRNGYATKQISLASEVSASVTEMDILPKNIKNIATIDYIVENGAASVSAATKEQLIGLLTYDSGIDMVKFQKLFLCTYPTFMGSMEFLDAIVSRFENATKDVTHSRVIMLLALWINIQLVHIRTNVELKNSILSFVNQQCTKDEFTEQLLEITILLNEGIVQNLPTTIGNHWTLVKPKELAKSLCMISHRLLRQIPLTNLIDGQYTRAIDETNPIPLNDFSKWFNIEYNWAASSIILAESAIECAALIQIFIAIISKCIRLHNFSSAMAIYSALNMGAVQRLSTAWSLIAPKNNKLMAEFDRVFSFKMNFGAYRDILKTTSLPCIPLFTVIGRDLTHLEEASPKFIREEEVTKINFERLSGIASHLIYFRNCQIVQFDFNDKNSVTLENQLREIKTYQKEELYEISNANETKHAAEQAAKKKKKPSLRDARESFAKPPASPPSPAPEVLASPNLEKKRQKKRRVKPNEPSAQLPRTRASSVSVKQKQPKRHVNDLFWDDNSILG